MWKARDTRLDRLVAIKRLTPHGERSQEEKDDRPARADGRHHANVLGKLVVYAARENDLESVRMLLAVGADVNQVTNYG